MLKNNMSYENINSFKDANKRIFQTSIKNIIPQQNNELINNDQYNKNLIPTNAQNTGYVLNPRSLVSVPANTDEVYNNTINSIYLAFGYLNEVVVEFEKIEVYLDGNAERKFKKNTGFDIISNSIIQSNIQLNRELTKLNTYFKNSTSKYFQYFTPDQIVDLKKAIQKLDDVHNDLITLFNNKSLQLLPKQRDLITISNDLIYKVIGNFNNYFKIRQSIKGGKMSKNNPVNLMGGILILNTIPDYQKKIDKKYLL